MRVDKISYGMRKCMHCNKEFEAFKAGEITCSEECRKARRRERDKVSRQQIESDLEWLNCKYEDLKESNIEASEILTVSAYMDFADAKDEMEWLNCSLENLLHEKKKMAIRISVAESNLEIRCAEIQDLKNRLEAATARQAEERKPEAPKKEAAKSQKATAQTSTPQIKGKGQFLHTCKNCGAKFYSTRKDDDYCGIECFREDKNYTK